MLRQGFRRSRRMCRLNRRSYRRLLSSSESVWASEGTWRIGGEKGFIAAVEELGKGGCGFLV